MWKMWKTSARLGGKSLENGEKPKSSPHRFPQKDLGFVENLKKSKCVHFAQLFLLLAEKWKKEEAKKWEKRRNSYP